MAANQNTSSIISSIYNSKKNILDLMEKQGYQVVDYKNFSINEINTMYQNNQLDMLLEMNKEDVKTKRKNKIYIKYYLGKVIRPSTIQEVIDDLFYLEEILTKEDTLFIIIKDDMNETVMNELKHLWEKDGIFIVMQSIKGLQFNILEHVLVPEHRVMNEDETSIVMNKYNIKEKTQFPDISRFDPVAQVIGLRPGKVCEITRISKTAISSKYYRVCV
jgi:DNA-directed RNA polymerase subunit H